MNTSTQPSNPRSYGKAILIFKLLILIFLAPVSSGFSATPLFKVTSPNTEMNLVSGNVLDIKWDVSGTNAAPYNVSFVKISLSTNGGASFSTILKESTPNDGSESVLVPNLPTTAARIKVETIGQNIFDLSDVSFTIQTTEGVVATPVISYSNGTIAGVNLQITCATPSAIIYYTTSGNIPVPGTSFTKIYLGTFALLQNTSIRAIAMKPGFTNSSVSLLNVIVPGAILPTPTPVITPGTGTYQAEQTVSISSNVPNVVIYYTTSGNVPVVGTTFTKQYTVPFKITNSGTVRAIAIASGMNQSATAVSFLTILQPSQVATPGITPATGSLIAPVAVTITCGTPQATIYYSTTGNEPVPGAGHTKIYTGPFTLTTSATVRAMARKTNLNQSATSVAFLTINNPSKVADPVITPTTATFQGPQNVSILCTTPGATIYYTTSGNNPVIGTGFTKIYTGSFMATGSMTVRAMAIKSGMTGSGIIASFLTITNTPGRINVSQTEWQEPAGQLLENLKIYPNPTSGILQIQLPRQSEKEITILIYNSLGSEVLRNKIESEISQKELDLSGLKPGCYFIKTDGPENSPMQRIIKN